MYSSKAQGQYPLGVCARFIPDIADSRFFRPYSASLAHRNSLLKHVAFMKATSTAFCHNIIQLDHFNRKMGMTLRQAIMHISSPTRSNMNLFEAVDTTFDGS
jgi:hypothetical protein